MSVVLFQKSTGQIIGVEYANDAEDVNFKTNDDIGAINAPIDDARSLIYDHMVVSDVVVRIPEKISEAHEWDWSSKTWVFSSKLFDEFKGRSIAEVNDQASDIITERLPIWKQNNMLARAIELQAKSEWAQDETSEWNFLQSEWDWVKSIRAASNVATQAISSSTTIEEIDIAVENFNAQIVSN